MTENIENGLWVGYITCGCRDCFELTIGMAGDFCDECIESGCDPEAECRRGSAYFDPWEG